MKVKVWTLIVDNGDGSSSAHQFKNAQEIKDHLEEDADEDFSVGLEEITDGATIFDQYDYPCEVSVGIFDTDGYEVVE
jgi:hypothetical protein